MPQQTARAKGVWNYQTAQKLLSADMEDLEFGMTVGTTTRIGRQE